MKKIIFLLFGGMMVMGSFANPCFAQKSVQSVAIDNNKTFSKTIRNINELENLGSGATPLTISKRINPKAVDDFQIRYTAASDVLWISNADGFVSYFTKDGLTNRVYYDKKGRWVFSVLLYHEDGLPKNIRKVVRSQYFDLAITLVEELQIPDHTTYIVYLEDKLNIKILKVNEEGEPELLQELTKCD
ncbi:MAG TPA: hypothetical protein VII28_05380 [Puia sp.]